MAEELFSQKLDNWLKDGKKKTLGELFLLFREKSFAVAFLVLMAPAALPIPTAGISHLLELITMLLALELIIGRQEIWAPNSWRQRNLGQVIESKALPKLVRFISWFEKRSQKRLASLLKEAIFLRIIGVFVLIFAMSAFLAIPFSNLDTLPALGVCMLSLGLILDDAIILVFAIGIGIVGIIVEIGLGALILSFLNR